jgi:hypothetical protein
MVLKTYAHLMPDAEDRARRAIEDALAADGPETYPRGAQACDRREP